ncbi:MAG: aminomethyl-transferring glycine dehydrogenase subunit GcvPB [Firmicutes bacterium]|nr:aminomethyl-transferring glycine dehydrogenase subunit GcvPB [Bacillota bacterium]
MKKGDRDVLRRFHEAKWDEPVIFELSTAGERGVLPPEVEKEIADEVGDGVSSLPESMRRKRPPALPELSQARVLRHYLRLSQETLGADLNVDVGQGTCTMKYSPKVNDQLAGMPEITELHPLQDEATVQGILEIMYNLDLFMREISGMDQFSLQPGGGSQAMANRACMIRAYHESRGDKNRDEMLTTIFSHPSDAAAAAVAGFKVITVPPGKNGYPDLEAFEKAISDRTAGLMITNPEDTGIFNPDIDRVTRMVHDAGGLCAYDQANANGMLGITRAREAGFDMCFFNLHKSFSTPHGCGGPASAALGVSRELARFLPVPIVSFDGRKYYLDYDRPDSIGKVRTWYGVPPVHLKAYSWIVALGDEGLKEVARIAVLNNNYVMKKVLEMPGASAPYGRGRYRLEQVRYSWERLRELTGVTTDDIQRRAFDFGVHYWTSHHPFVVPEPMTVEPTESYSKAELDEFLNILRHIVHEAQMEPEKVRNAPYNSVVRRIPSAPFDDPDRWAITWRAYLKKQRRERAPGGH